MRYGISDEQAAAIGDLHHALDAGATYVNDVTAFRAEPEGIAGIIEEASDLIEEEEEGAVLDAGLVAGAQRALGRDGR